MPNVFRGFPDGRTGLGLFLLRATLGTAALILGRSDMAAGVWVAGWCALGAGVALWIGVATPLAAALVGLAAAAIWTSVLPPVNPSLFASGTSLVFVAAVAAAVVLLGPGAFSLDARLFGLREIIIPPRVSAAAIESHDRGISR